MTLLRTAVLAAFCASVGGCGALYPDPVGRIRLTAEQQRHCNYIGQLHGDDPGGFGGNAQRAACMRYVRDTGELPPPI